MDNLSLGPPLSQYLKMTCILMNSRPRLKSSWKCLNELIGNTREPLFNLQDAQEIYYTNFGDDPKDDENDLPYGTELLDLEISEMDENYIEATDEYINAQVVIPNKEGVPVLAKIKKRKRDADGQLVGERNSNPILDSRIYELEFPDGGTAEYAVNVIAENLFNQADKEGWDTGLLSEIVGLRKDNNVAVPKEKGVIKSYNGQDRNVITTKG